MYSRNMVDYHLIMDMIPVIARMYFLKQLGNIGLSVAQSVSQLCVLLRFKSKYKNFLYLSQNLSLRIAYVILLGIKDTNIF